MLKQWAEEKLTEINSEVTIADSEQARAAITSLDFADAALKARAAANVASFRKLGDDIRSVKHATAFSTWFYPHTSELFSLESAVSKLWTELEAAIIKKRAILDDALARETFVEATRLMAEQHLQEGALLTEWATTQIAYLETTEVHYHGFLFYSLLMVKLLE